MASLTIPNIFTAGTPALASEVNANFNAIINWSNGGLDYDNMDTFSGPLQFLIANGNAITIQNNGNDESIKITQGALLGAGKASILIDDQQTQTVGDAELKMVLAAGATIPAIHVTHGVDTFKLTKDYLRLEALLKPPVKTTVQRNAIVSPEEGSILYNSTDKTLSIYSGTSWVLPAQVDDTTVEYNTNKIRIKDLGVTESKLASNSVTTSKILNGNVTRIKLGPLGQQISSSSGNFSLSPLGSWVDVTNLTVTITTNGNPVFLSIQADGSSSGSQLAVVNSVVDIRILRGASVVFLNRFGSGTGDTVYYPVSINYLDTPSAGTYTYKVQANMSNLAGNAASVRYATLLAYEV